MKKRIYQSETIELLAGSSLGKADFPRIEGTIIGVSTHVLGDRGTQRAKLEIADGGQEAYRPLDIAFTETNGRGSFEAGVLPVQICNPGNIKATITLDAAVPVDGDFKVEVLLVTERDQ